MRTVCRSSSATPSSASAARTSSSAVAPALSASVAVASSEETPISMLAPSGGAPIAAEPVTVSVPGMSCPLCASARSLPPSRNTPTASATISAIPIPIVRSRPIALPFVPKPAADWGSPYRFNAGRRCRVPRGRPHRACDCRAAHAVRGDGNGGARRAGRDQRSEGGTPAETTPARSAAWMLAAISSTNSTPSASDLCWALRITMT